MRRIIELVSSVNYLGYNIIILYINSILELENSLSPGGYPGYIVTKKKERVENYENSCNNVIVSDHHPPCRIFLCIYSQCIYNSCHGED